MSKQPLGVIAAGHKKTAAAAKIILEEGGNAFDAVVAAGFAACVAEPVLTSLGGGGFLLARTGDGRELVYDFFVQTPRHRRTAATAHFHPVLADFGTTAQEFHIGMASIAVPGTVKGLFRIHRDLGSLPLKAIIEPALTLARRGVRITALSAYLFRILEPIIKSSSETWANYRSKQDRLQLLRRGETHKQPELADTLENLIGEGEHLFYRGEIADRLVRACRENGGNLRAEDLASYRVIRRKPLGFHYRGARVLTNPPPSSGGILVAFSLKLLEGLDLAALGSGTAPYLNYLAQGIEQANRARARGKIEQEGGLTQARKLLGERFLRPYRQALIAHPLCSRGTTHISIIDSAGNMAAMTTSNGEGSGYVVAGTGIMMNNMLGEEDINPHGFHRWPRNRRMASMMAPSLLLAADGTNVALGSGGSNRIRSAILQALINIVDFGMPLQQAVSRPRIHYENGLLSMEKGFRQKEITELAHRFPQQELWEAKNLFFGGVHAVAHNAARHHASGAGDPRRGGVSIVVQ